MTAAEHEGDGLYRLEQPAIRCPHPTFDRYREEAPARWVPEVEAFAVTRYDDIVAVNRQPELFSNRTATGPVLARQMRELLGAIAAEDPELRRHLGTRVTTPVLLSADPPLHTRQRSLVGRAFSARRVRAMEADIERVAGELIDAFPAGGHVELVRAFAVPLPLTVIAVALGVPVERMGDFKRWSDDFVVAIGNHRLTKADLVSMLASQAEFFDYFAEQADARRRRPRDDLLTDIVTARIDGEELTEGEVLGMLAQFLVAGNETTTKLIASATLRLAHDPELAGQLRRRPALVAPFVEEVLRLDAPVQGLFRVATEDTTVGGVPIPAGSALWLVYAAGNRDPQRWAGRDDCRLDRDWGHAHLAFGLGAHFCVGANLARAEARIGIERLLARCSHLALDVDDDALAYEPSYVLHGLAALPLVLAPP